MLKPGGVLIGVGICRFASALVGLIYGYLEDPEFVQIIRQDLKDGQHRNPTETPRYLTEAYFHHPEELEREVSDAGLQVVELLAIEGPAVFLQDLEEKWEDPDHRQRILDILAWLESDPSILGMTSHAVVIARKN